MYSLASKISVAPSMLSADFLHLGKDVDMVNRCADIFHLDVMDGVLVPNISYGFPIVEAIASRAERPMDAHLMIVHPEKYVERFAEAGVSMLSFHLEAASLSGEDPLRLAGKVRDLGMKSGLAINPDIPIPDVFPYLEGLDYVLVMSVFAGFGGQRFIEASIQRIRELKSEIDRRGLDCAIEVDGGVSLSNAHELVDAGASVLVAGSSVFGSEHPEEVIRIMRGSDRVR